MLDLTAILNSGYDPETKLIFICMANAKDFTQLDIGTLQTQTSLSSAKIKKALKGDEFEIVRDWAKTVIKSKCDDSQLYSNDCKSLLLYFNTVSKKQFRNTDQNLKFIKARLESGVTYDEMKAIIELKVKDWTGTQMEKYLRPETLFNATKFETYYAESKGMVVAEEIPEEQKEVQYSDAELSIYSCD